MDRPLDDQSGWSRACTINRLTAERMICARIDDVDLLLIWHEGRAIACERACPHEQADLSHGHITNGRLVCPHHAASFDLQDGTISNGWSSHPLQIYPVRVEGDDVWVRLDASKFA